MAELHDVDDQILEVIWLLLEGLTEPLKQYHLGVAKALTYMADHFQEKISLQDLTTHACVSRSHLGRLFQDEVGVSPMRFLTLLRVEKSKLLLANRRFSVTEAGLASGFGSLRSFERAFERWVGCTPIQYRNKVLLQVKRSGTQGQ